MSEVEILGYLASIFVAISLLMSNIKLLRYVNTVGCFLFVAYGVWIEAYPVAVMNGFCVLINVYHLWKLKKAEKMTDETA